MSNKPTLNLEYISDYVFEQSVRDDELLQALREETAQDEMARMQISAEQGQLMALLIKLIGAKRIIEVGTFTGYSSLCMARALPKDGELICCDVSEQWTSIAKRYWQQAGVQQKIKLVLAPARETLQSLLDEQQHGQFDFAFIDADKDSYDEYYEQCLQLLRPNGLLLLDNMLWSGRVADPDCNDEDTVAIRKLNKKLKNDARVDISLLTVADGISMIRKK